MDRLLPLVAALLIVAAGCTTAPTDSGTNPTAVPAGTTATTEPISETTQSTDTIDDLFAPGVNATSVTNVSSLLEAHTATLRDRGFRLVVNQTRTGEDGPGYVYEQQTVAEAGLQQYRRATVGQADGERRESNQWANATLITSRSGNETATSYDSRELPDWSNDSRDWRATGITHVGELRSLLAGGDYVLTEVTRTDGERLATFVATDVTAADSQPHYGERRVEVVVSDAGYVRELNVSGTLAESDATFTYEYRVPTLDVEGVSPPAWLADAPKPVHAEIRLGFEGCNGTILTLDHEGGDTVPAGTTIEVTAGGETYRAALDTQLRDGDTRYLALVDGEMEIVSEKPTGDSVGSFPNEVSYEIRTDAGLRLSSGGMGFGCETSGSESTMRQSD